MWWIIGVLLAVVIFICWLIWEMLHAPLIPELSDGFNLDEDDEDDEEIHS